MIKRILTIAILSLIVYMCSRLPVSPLGDRISEQIRIYTDKAINLMEGITDA